MIELNELNEIATPSLIGCVNSSAEKHSNNKGGCYRVKICYLHRPKLRL